MYNIYKFKTIRIYIMNEPSETKMFKNKYNTERTQYT